MRDGTGWTHRRIARLLGTLAMTLGTILLIVLLLLVIGSLPVYPHSREWGYYPSGGLGTALVIVLVLYLLGVF